MSTQFQKIVYEDTDVRLMMNFSGIEDNIADESLTLSFYAFKQDGCPVFTKTLDLEGARAIYEQLNAVSVISRGAKISGKFVESTETSQRLHELLEETDIGTLVAALDRFESSTLINSLIEALSDLDLAHLQGAYHQRRMETELEILRSLVSSDLKDDLLQTVSSDPTLEKYKAGQQEKVFQNWLESNLWIFGVDYIRKYEARKIAIFSEADLLMESVDGFLDLIELKRPVGKLLKYDNSHNCFYPHPHLSEVIGQSLFYLQKLTEYKLILEKEYSSDSMKVLMPRIKIVIGDSSDFKQEESEAIRMLNSNLVSIQIVTYSDLIEYGNRLIEATKTSLSKDQAET